MKFIKALGGFNLLLLSRGLNLRLIERYTFYYLNLSYLFGGIAGSIFLFNDVLAKKTLHATNFELTILAIIMPMSLLFSVFFSNLMKGRDHRPFLFWSAVLGRLPLLLVLFVSTATPFIIVIFLASLASAVSIPPTNTIYQSNMSEQVRGKAFGVATSIFTLVTLFGSLLVGSILDLWEQSYRILYAFSAILGFLSIYYIIKIRVRHESHAPDEEKGEEPNGELMASYYISEWVLKPIRNTTRLLREHPKFALFERNFFMYGFAFLMLQPVLPVYLVEVVKLNYTQVSLAKGIFFYSSFILLSPLLGILLDKVKPFMHCSIILFILATFPFSLIFIKSPIAIYLAYFVFGIGMAGINIVWTLGSLHFAGKGEAAEFMGVHVTLTGLRGLLAPLWGYILLTFFGMNAAFSVSCATFLIASLLMFLMTTNLKIKYLTV